MTPAQAQRRYLVLSGLRWFSTGLAFPVHTLLYATRGVDLPTIGLLMALYSATVIVLELPTGGLADLLGRRRTLLVATALSVAALVSLALARTVWQFAASAVLSAVARALGSGPLEAWYVDTVRTADPAASLRPGISRGWAVEALGLGAAATLGGWLPGRFADALPAGGLLTPMSVPVLVAAALGVVSLVVHAALMTEPRPAGPVATASRPGAAAGLVDAVRDVPAQVREGLRLATADPVIRLLTLRIAAFGVGIAALEVLTPLQLAGLLGGANRASMALGLLATAAWLGSATGSASAPALCRVGDRLGLRGPLGTATALTALCGTAVALIGLAAAGPGGFALVAAGYNLAYVFGGAPGPLATEAMHERVDAGRRATLVSVGSLALQLGALTGSLVLPRLTAWAGFPAGWLAASAAVLGAAALTLRAHARARARDLRATPNVHACTG